MCTLERKAPSTLDVAVGARNLGLSEDYPGRPRAPHRLPVSQTPPFRRQETVLRLTYAGAFRLLHVACPHPVPPVVGMARWMAPADRRQAHCQSGAPRQKKFSSCSYRKRAPQAVKRSKCNPLVEPTDWGKRTPSFGCVSCVRCPRGTSGTFLRRYAKCAAIFYATGGCRHRR